MWVIRVDVETNDEQLKDYVLGDIDSWRRTQAKVSTSIRHEDAWIGGTRRVQFDTSVTAGVAVAEPVADDEPPPPPVEFEPARRVEVNELTRELPFEVYLPSPPPADHPHVLLRPRALGQDTAVAATITYGVMDGDRHRGNVWVTLSAEQLPEQRLDQWMVVRDVEACEDRSGGYYRCKARGSLGETYVHVESTGHRRLDDVVAVFRSLAPALARCFVSVATEGIAP